MSIAAPVSSPTSHQLTDGVYIEDICHRCLAVTPAEVCVLIR
ncbi:MAG TPA: hypothetical protein PLV37_07205 [Bacillota bacterium]|nr:hypothetical protein [Bacillota bacterium]